MTANSPAAACAFLSAVCGGLPPYHTTFLPGWEAENQKKRVRGGELGKDI